VTRLLELEGAAANVAAEAPTSGWGFNFQASS
jgi:hypothetical protein